MNIKIPYSPLMLKAVWNFPMSDNECNLVWRWFNGFSACPSHFAGPDLSPIQSHQSDLKWNAMLSIVNMTWWSYNPRHTKSISAPRRVSYTLTTDLRRKTRVMWPGGRSGGSSWHTIVTRWWSEKVRGSWAPLEACQSRVWYEPGAGCGGTGWGSTATRRHSEVCIDLGWRRDASLLQTSTFRIQQTETDRLYGSFITRMSNFCFQLIVVKAKLCLVFITW